MSIKKCPSIIIVWNKSLFGVKIEYGERYAQRIKIYPTKMHVHTLKKL